MKLTDITLRSLKPPASGAVIYSDDTLPGFGVRISQGGTRSYVLTHGVRRQRETIGRVGIIKLSEAREEAKRRLAEYTLGKTKTASVTWEAATDSYLTEIGKTRKARTHRDYRYALKHFRFGETKLTDISHTLIATKLDKLADRPSEQSHALAVLRSFLKWAHRRHLIDHNPIERIAAPVQSRPRERVLSPLELSQVFKTAWNGTSPFHAIVSLLILTGQRRGEISALQRAWRKNETITLPAELTKNGRAHTFPLSQMAQECLERQPEYKDSPYFFPASKDRWKAKPATTFNGWGKAKAAFDLECGVKDWTLHDLRRTFATNLAGLGVTIPVIEKLLNHVSGTFGGIVGVYQKYDFLPEMKAALEKWEQYLETLQGTGTVPAL